MLERVLHEKRHAEEQRQPADPCEQFCTHKLLPVDGRQRRLWRWQLGRGRLRRRRRWPRCRSSQDWLAGSRSKVGIAGGMVSFWIGVGREKPISLTPRMRSGWSPKVEKGMRLCVLSAAVSRFGSGSPHDYSGFIRERRNRRRGLRSWCNRPLIGASKAPQCRTSRAPQSHIHRREANRDDKRDRGFLCLPKPS